MNPENNDMKKKFYRWIIAAASLVMLTGLGACSSAPPNSYAPHYRSKAASIVTVAKSMIGRPYKYGGNSPRTGFDCSGLVYYTLRKNGIDAPRTSYAQYRATHPVSRRYLRPGDLLFFRVSSRKVSHVGIYLGKNRFVHAPSSGKEVSISHLDSPYWSRRFIRGGRITL
jgi:cell wall-associated NlpC family hydrolase